MIQINFNKSPKDFPVQTSDENFSFNVNGLRARLHQMSALIDKHSPDIICLQETKVDNENYPHGEHK